MKVLHIIPYSKLYPPQNGGQLRCFHLMDQLAKNNKLDVLIYQDKNEIADKGYKNENIRFINPSFAPIIEGLFKYLPNRLKVSLRYRWLTKTLFETASKEVLEFAHVIKKLAKHGENYDYVVFEHLGSGTLHTIVKRYFPNAQLILDAHNIDYKLTTEIKLKRKIYNQESRLFTKVHRFWACSQLDVNELVNLNNFKIQGQVVPNGVDAESRPFCKDKSLCTKNILFCGTLDYYPNEEGLNWFYEKVWPKVINQMPDTILTIIGRGDLRKYNFLKNDSSIKLIGPVDEVVPYYQQSYIAIVPLLSGSGTRLKVLEAMSLGNPIVTTSIGIEGIESENGKYAIVADSPELFANAIIELIKNNQLGEIIRINARSLVERKYDWNKIGENLL